MDNKLIKIIKFIEEEIGLDVSEISKGEYIIDSSDFVINIQNFSSENRGKA